MKLKKVIVIVSALIIVAACKSSKKSTKTANSSPAATNTTTNVPPVTKPPVVKVAKSSDGIHAPGEEELRAIQLQYEEVTMANLQEGYSIYKTGACIQCHSPKNIYGRYVVSWKGVIDDMAQKAEISDTQKDAVYKYVLSIKAAQP